MGLGGGPLMMMKIFLFQLILDILGNGFGAGRGPPNDDEEFFVSVDIKYFRKWVWGWEGAH